MNYLVILRTMNKYIQLFRPGNCIMGIVGTFIAVWMAAGTDIVDYAVELILVAVLVFVFIAGGNALNDSIDYEIDKVSHPERPVPSGKITPDSARKIGYGMLTVSVLASLLSFDIGCIAVVLIAAALMVLYETRFKQRGFIGNITIAVLTGMLFLLGSAIVGNIMLNASVALLAMLVSIGREIAKDIEDEDGDVGRFTLPMRIGKKRAATVASFFFILGALLSFIPLTGYINPLGPLYLIVIVSDIIFAYCAYIVHSDPHKAQKYAKKGMVLGLVAFALGAIRI